MKVAILQPAYLSWVGVFALMDSVDAFVFYDDVQFESQSWQQRNRIKTANGVQWLTVPVIKKFGQKINEVEINFAMDWRKKHWETIRQAYSQSPFFEQSSYFWEDFYIGKWNYLSEMNMYLMRLMAEGFDIKLPRFYRSSDFTVSGQKTDRLIMLLEKLGATEYISGLAAKDYIEAEKFKNIELKWFHYTPMKYPQRGEFVPYLSAIDLLFNVGSDSIKYIREGNIGL